MSAKSGGDPVPLYPCPCGCGKAFSTGNGAMIHAVNKVDAAHEGVDGWFSAYEEFTHRMRRGGSL